MKRARPRAARNARTMRPWSEWHSGGIETIAAERADRLGAGNGRPVTAGLLADPAVRAQLAANGLYARRPVNQRPRSGVTWAEGAPAPAGSCAQLEQLALAAGQHECGYPPGSRSCRLVCGGRS